MRLFDYRQEQPWPPIVTKRANWDSLYAEQSEGLSVLPNVDEAVEWANALIAEIDNA